VEIKGQLDAADWFFLFQKFIACSTCFGHYLCPSSGAQEYYTDGCYLWYLVLWFSSCRSGVELRVMCPVCGMLQQAINFCNKKTNLLHLVGLLFPRIENYSLKPF